MRGGCSVACLTPCVCWSMFRGARVFVAGLWRQLAFVSALLKR